MTGHPPGRLLLVPNTLDLGAAEVPLTDVLPTGVIERAAKLLHWVVEDARSARAFLNRVNKLAPLAQPLQATRISELPRPPKGQPRPQAAAHDALAQATAYGGSLAEARDLGTEMLGELTDALHHPQITVRRQGQDAVVTVTGQSTSLLGIAETVIVTDAGPVQSFGAGR